MQQTGLPDAAVQVVRLHDARLLLQSLVLGLHRIGDKVAAAAAFRSAVRWEDARALLIECQTATDAKPLRQCHQFLARHAAECGMERILLSWKGCDRPYAFKATMQPDATAAPTVRSDKPELAALMIGELMNSAELPMGLIDLELDDQVWANEALARLKNQPVELLRSQNVRQLWSPDALDYIKSALRQQGILENHRYEADLNPGMLCRFQSKFELVIDGRYRLTTLYECDPIGTAAR